MADAPHPAGSEQGLAPADAGHTPKPFSPTVMAEPNGTSNTPTADLSAAAATHVRPGGAPARVYLNEKVVPHLLEGMKAVARDQ
ncbi:hypothetical protein N7468_003353 [Penicillium chermesinum]|uniref:COMPASS complex subunit Sdc1 n=1 Tax=Penicillium chermesinum TaxID=63820 RepID=A0A9W9TTA6_9EURO|nr:uncharacterized protein N7468_003353 [Penicillium chermesinum]KAJ5238734.1 hypothetical protein N7468_003353 [Penicillium chermesinum]KAJ6164379.1 hypothetical protein N7470_003051 [Penicillium chermesinum]